MALRAHLVIAVTGTPGTGKTFLSTWLCKTMRFGYLDVTSIIRKRKVPSTYDRKARTRDVSVPALVRALSKEIRSAKKDIVIDSHLSHELPPSQVDVCIVTRAPLRTIKRRLRARGYPPTKVEENLQSEIFEVCLHEAISQGHRVLAIDTSRNWKAKLRSYMMTKKKVLARHQR